MMRQAILEYACAGTGHGGLYGRTVEEQRLEKKARRSPFNNVAQVGSFASALKNVKINNYKLCQL